MVWVKKSDLLIVNTKLILSKVIIFVIIFYQITQVEK